ncbi:alpha/beta hydrolase family protein [Qipengyuania sp. CAU 1752]
MKLFKAACLAAAGTVMTLGLAPAIAGPQNQPTVPLEVWSLRDVVNLVQVSPDGKHLLVLKTESRDGEHILEIYDTNEMSKPLRRLNAKPMELISARWVSNNHIFGTAWQVKRSKVNGPEEDVREYATYSYNLEKNKFQQIDGEFSIVNSLPDEDMEVLVATGRDDSALTGVDPFSAFKPRSYYRYNLESGKRTLVMRGTVKYPRPTFDLQGNPRYVESYDAASKTVKTYYRLPGEGSWTEFGTGFDLDSHENLYRVLGGFQGLAGFKEDDPTIGYIIDNRGEDKAALWEFDFKTGQFGEKLFSTPDADVMGIATSSLPNSSKLVAAVYPGEKYERAWFDAEEAALYAQFQKLIPEAHQLSISSRSLDGGTMVVQNTGPKDPGSFWFVKDGSITKLGSRNPLLKPEQLSDVEFIKYPARDGHMIPAYLTKPKGEGPFPLIVLPHGGPHVTEVVTYDEWGQLLANAGYMVLQPQYRMSVGWGQKHFDDAYGQHGLLMQDDKDDGVKHLIDQGLVDPDRVAMFGWSYGGYAALVALTRENNLYQCAIAGAAVADPEKVYMLRRSPNDAKALDDWSQRRGMIGINPIKEVGKPSIPLLMVHGDVDARVLYFNFKDYKEAMDKAGKTNAQYLTLKGADHFSRTLMYEHQEAFYTKMIDYLANDCGPGGL